MIREIDAGVELVLTLWALAEPSTFDDAAAIALLTTPRATPAPLGSWSSAPSSPP